MKKSIILKYGIIFVLSASLVICVKTVAENHQPQTIEVENLGFSVERQEFFCESEGIVYDTPYAQVYGLSDKKIEDRVNETLKSAAVLWATEESLWSSRLTVHVAYVDSNYLSILYHRIWREGISDDLRINVIVDLHTGERLFLDDLVEFTDAFIEAMLAQNYKFKGSELYSSLPEDDIQRVLHEASISELEFHQELAEEDPYFETNPPEGGTLTRKASVRLSPIGMIITRSIHPFEDIVIPWDQVPDLKIQLNPDMACSSSLDMYKEGKQKPWQSKLYFPWYP